MPLKYRRVLLKISGEMLAGEQTYGIQPSILHNLASEIADVLTLNVEIAIVIGGGNIFRGLAASASGMERASADYMGMLATLLNALALQNALESKDIPTRVLSAIEMRQLAESYIRRRAIRHLEKKRVVPGISLTIARSRCSRAFSKLDLPTLGLPSINSLIPSWSRRP